MDKILHRIGHKNNCICYVCKTIRGEIKGKNHPMYGKIHPNKGKTFDIIIGVKKSNERAKKISIKLKGKSFTIEHRKNISLSKKGQEYLKENGKKVGNLNKGKNNTNYGGKCRSLKRIKYKNIFFRSSWEVIVAKWLERNNYNWKYEPKRFYFKNLDFTYLPDFFVEELNSYIEVKGWYTNICKKKIKAFKKYYPQLNFLIIDSNNIDNYKIKENEKQ